MSGFSDRPQTVLLRRWLFQVHLWTGLIAGLYLLLVCATGAALVFRIDMQRATYPELLSASAPGPLVDVATALDSLRARYPEARLSGVDAPSTARPTFLAYVTDSDGLHTVLLDPVTARVLGELPERSAIRTLQQLHFRLLLGKTGLLINGIGALCLLALCATGLVIWWQGRSSWHRGFTVRWRAPWRQVLWDVHSAVGIWCVVLLVLWAVTALSFTFSRQFRQVVHSISPISTPVQLRSTPTPTPAAAALSARELIEKARQNLPGQYVARVVLPANETATFQVLFSARQPTPVGVPRLTTVQLDQYSGQLLASPITDAPRSVGDAVMQWAAPLHVGNFGGLPIKLLWMVVGLAPVVLFVSGAIGWWQRVVRPGRAS